MKVIQHKIFANRSRSTAKTILKPLVLKQQSDNMLKKPQQIMKKISLPAYTNTNAVIMLVHKYERPKIKMNIS